MQLPVSVTGQSITSFPMESITQRVNEWMTPYIADAQQRSLLEQPRRPDSNKGIMPMRSITSTAELPVCTQDGL